MYKREHNYSMLSIPPVMRAVPRQTFLHVPLHMKWASNLTTWSESCIFGFRLTELVNTLATIQHRLRRISLFAIGVDVAVCTTVLSFTCMPSRPWSIHHLTSTHVFPNHTFNNIVVNVQYMCTFWRTTDTFNIKSFGRYSMYMLFGSWYM